VKLREISGVVALGFILSISIPGVRGATPLASRPGQVLAEDQIETLERKLLQRTFPFDKEDKRLQRLECLVFGATQAGSLQERWAELKRSVAQPARSQAAPDKSLISSVTQVERAVLKKTNPGLPIATRLSQLEAKVFGQTSPAMPLPQRVERLRKTIGLTDPLNSPQTAIQPFGSGTLPGGGTFSFRVYGDPNGFDQRQMDPQMGQMLKEMDRQMRQMERFGDGMLDDGMREFNMPNGSEGFRYDFSFPNPQGTNPFIQINPGKPGKPGQPGSNGKPGQPGKPGSSGIIIRQAPTQPIPPYGAPDSI
jgi:hypothetical protein